ncbi:hypothetical protein AVW16_08365 [Crenobacter luteus]|uniref:UspA domain-containing protein n=2 Tax=Crenobacter luteus TaxID=1452487 RepID=A0A161SI63_9NEIS|nr:hypothetical protein AVW16_08365 [Crenobacter luteus]
MFSIKAGVAAIGDDAALAVRGVNPRPKENTMLKNLLLVLDAGPIAEQARELALSLAQTHGAGLTALSLIDTAPLHAGEAAPAGGSAFLEARNAKWEAEWLEGARERIVHMREAAAAAGVTVSSVLAEDDQPDVALLNQARMHDLVVASSDCHLGAESRPHDTHWLSRYLADAPRPLLLLTPAYRPQAADAGFVVLAYDGSTSAARALQQFAFLGVGHERPRKVVAIHPDAAEAGRLADEGAAYLASHGLPAQPVPIASAARPRQLLLAELDSQHASLLVMGTFGHRSWLDRLFGAATETMIARCTCPVLLCH